MRARVALAAAVVLTAVVLGAGCASGGRETTPSPSPPSLAGRPLPSAAPELRTELAAVADVLEIPGDGAGERHDRLQGCIRIARLHEHLTTKARRVATAEQLRVLADANRTCPTDQAAAARLVRDLTAPAS